MCAQNAHLRLIVRAAAKLSHSLDTGKCRNRIRNKDGETHLENSGGVNVSTEQGVTVIDRDQERAGRHHEKKLVESIHSCSRFLPMTENASRPGSSNGN